VACLSPPTQAFLLLFLLHHLPHLPSLLRPDDACAPPGETRCSNDASIPPVTRCRGSPPPPWQWLHPRRHCIPWTYWCCYHCIRLDDASPRLAGTGRLPPYAIQKANSVPSFSPRTPRVSPVTRLTPAYERKSNPPPRMWPQRVSSSVCSLSVGYHARRMRWEWRA
jgi:hypothetical protein